ncbi:MAG: PmoA family protein [Planctomycetaceae bacterium]|nr:PmoA family protein [Planctomycetaceae bacterium]
MAALTRCEVVPLPDHQVSFQVDGQEVTCWHFGPQAPRPYFYPIRGPRSGASLTRMGHPGAPNHDHHRSVWFAHQQLLGIDFWSDQTEARIRQQEWLVYQDGDAEAAMAVKLGWYDGHDTQPLLDQELIAILRPLENDEYTLDLHSTFVPRAEQIEFQQTNFGFLAVRMAKSISVHFGDGKITGSEGTTGEADLFGQPSAWIDYSGMVAVTGNSDRSLLTEGITYFDHPRNVSYPSKWHVREDGWMGASACRDQAIITTREDPLRLRYRLHIHHGPADLARAGEISRNWAVEPDYRTVRATEPHQSLQIERI